MNREDVLMKRRLNTKRWRENNPEKVREYNRLKEQSNETKSYRKEYNKKHGARNAKVWRDKNPNKARDSYLKYTYGISLDEYNKKLTEQGGVCDICKKTQSNGRNLCVDHNHKTLEIRGLLCLGCNSAIGHMIDDTDLLHSAIKYLQRHS